MPQPELSIIVPLLNEAAGLANLFATIDGQSQVRIELILCDGGSTDGTVEEARRLIETAPFPVRLASSPAGRGRQMNAGAAESRAETLLFLHADSALKAPLALRAAMDALVSAEASAGHHRFAGHFRLRFRRQQEMNSAAWYYYEWKARLHRPGCTHGDQGLLLRRKFFGEIGTFREDLPFMEDEHLAERIGATGQWLLLPDELETSARRFETEGLRERQTMNAIMMNLAAIGEQDLLGRIPGLYRNGHRGGRLRLHPLLQGISAHIHGLPAALRSRFWSRTGSYVRGNAWQLAFALDARRNHRRGVPVGEGETPALDFYDRHLDRLTDNRAGIGAATLLTRLWFSLSILHARFREKAATGK